MADNGGLTLGGVTARSLGFRMLRSSKRPFIPATTDATAAIAGRNGAFDFGAKLQPALFALDCAIVTNSPEALQTTADALGIYLIDAVGKPRTMDLIFDLRPDKRYSVRYAGSLDFERIVGLGKFNLPLVAYDPHAYSVTVTTVSRTNAGSIVLNNAGPLEVWPLISVTGSFTNLSLTCSGRTLVFNEAKASAGTLTIDCEKMSAKLGATNKNHRVTGDWLKFAPGNNTITVSGTGLSCVVTIIFYAKYL